MTYMYLEQINKILSDQPDKNENLSTTSKKFKLDVYDFLTFVVSTQFSENAKFKDVEFNGIEFGTHRGQTTAILAYCSDNVYTINQTDQSLNEARQYHKELGITNVHYLPFNLYSKNKLDVDMEFSYAFIDAGHSYDEVRQDFLRCFELKWVTDELFIIFDDAALAPGVRAFLRELEKKNVEIHGIGHKGPYDFGQGRKISQDLYEGAVICINKDFKL